MCTNSEYSLCGFPVFGYCGSEEIVFKNKSWVGQRVWWVKNWSFNIFCVCNLYILYLTFFKDIIRFA